jgi:hypothetical protein
MGRLTSGTSSATVTAAAWAETSSGTVESGTYVSASATVTSSTTASLNALFYTTSPTMTAGEKKTLTLEIGKAYGYMYRELF